MSDFKVELLCLLAVNLTACLNARFVILHRVARQIWLVQLIHSVEWYCAQITADVTQSGVCTFGHSICQMLALRCSERANMTCLAMLAQMCSFFMLISPDLVSVGLQRQSFTRLCLFQILLQLIFFLFEKSPRTSISPLEAQIFLSA